MEKGKEWVAWILERFQENGREGRDSRLFVALGAMESLAEDVGRGFESLSGLSFGPEDVVALLRAIADGERD